SARAGPIWVLALAFLAGLLLSHVVPPRFERAVLPLCLALQAGCALALVWYVPGAGTAPVLLVVLVAQLPVAMPPRFMVPVVVALNIALYLLLRDAGYSQPLLVTTLYLGFQAFAVL